MHTAILIVTVSRLAIAFALAFVARESMLLPSIFLLAVLIGADIVDGKIARRFGVDSNTRRSADSCVDILSTHIVAIAFVYVHPQFFVLYVPLLVRDTAVAVVCFAALVRSRTLLIGGDLHKASALSKAGFFLCMLVFGAGAPTLVSAGIAWCLNYVLLTDYLGALIFKLEVEPAPGARFVTTLSGLKAIGQRIVITARHAYPRRFLAHETTGASIAGQLH